MVAPYEEREAARFNGYTWREWQDMDGWERALCVAYMRVNRAIGSHVAHAQVEAQKKANKKTASRSSRGGRRR